MFFAVTGVNKLLILDAQSYTTLKNLGSERLYNGQNKGDILNLSLQSNLPFISETNFLSMSLFAVWNL